MVSGVPSKAVCCKIGSADFVKRCFFLSIEPIFSIEAVILVQELPQCYRSPPSSKTLVGTLMVSDIISVRILMLIRSKFPHTKLCFVISHGLFSSFFPNSATFGEGEQVECI